MIPAQMCKVVNNYLGELPDTSRYFQILKMRPNQFVEACKLYHFFVRDLMEQISTEEVNEENKSTIIT